MIKIESYLNKYKFEILLMITCVMFALYGSSNGTSSYGIIAVVITLLMMVLVSTENIFLILVAMIPYGECWKISGVSIRGLMCIIPIVIIIIKGKLDTKKVGLFITGIAVILIEMLNDIFYNDVFTVINSLSPLMFIVIFALYENGSEKWDIKRMGYIYVMSTLISNISLLIIGGGFSSYNNDISYYRFGQESTSYLSSAMEIPIYVCISIYFLLIMLMFNFKNIFYNICNIALIILNLIFGFMTVSRVFIIGLITLFTVFFIWIIKSGKANTIGKFLVSLGIIIVFFKVFFGNLFSVLFNKLIFRLEVSQYTYGTDSDGRSDIWISCINYLSNNIKAFFLGKGILSYSIIGRNKGLPFSAMAHNYFLDIWMSVGIIGVLCIISIYVSIVKKNKCPTNFISWGILFILLMIFCVSGTLNYIRNYIYILFAIIFHNNFYDQIGGIQDEKSSNCISI